MTQATPPDSLGALLERRAAANPDRPAYAWLAASGPPAWRSYGALHARAHAVAARLRETARRGDRVLLLYPPGLDFIDGFLGCAVAGMIAVPAPAPDRLKPERSLARLQAIVRSAQPAFVLTTSDVLDAIRAAVAAHDDFARMLWLATDAVAPGDGPSRGFEPVGPDAIALIQYTSGSTADPKGAALSHGNVLHNARYLDEGWGHTPESVAVNWLPAFHDLGLVYGVLTPLWGGFVGLQMSPIDVIQRPYHWLRALSEHRATHATGPNFIYDLCARKVSDAEVATLDLRAWKMALTAAEPIRAETLARFAARFAPAGFSPRTFSPGYGLSEATCKVVAVPADEAPVVRYFNEQRLAHNEAALAPPGPGARAIVACGRPSHGVGVVIVDPATRAPCAAGRVGEVWVSGPGVARSYWEQPAATAALLRATLAGGDGTPHLRTGDLGFVFDESLYITGRIKDVIIVRGANHYPQDLEYTAQDAAPNVRPGCCAAFSYEEDGEERVAVVAEVERRTTAEGGAGLERRVADPVPALPPAPVAFDPADVERQIRTAIAAAHGLRVHRVELIKAGTIPKTTSGKIQRQACMRAMLAGRLARVG